jgi:hypothetical protein
MNVVYWEMSRSMRTYDFVVVLETMIVQYSAPDLCQTRMSYYILDFIYRQTQQQIYKLTHSHIDVHQWVYWLYNFCYMFRFIEPSSCTTLNILHYWIGHIYGSIFIYIFVVCTGYVHNRMHSVKVMHIDMWVSELIYLLLCLTVNKVQYIVLIHNRMHSVKIIKENVVSYAWRYNHQQIKSVDCTGPV